MTTKHTPGPEIYGMNSTGLPYGPFYRLAIGDKTAKPVPSRLIAAAPEMYEALQAILKEYQLFGPDGIDVIHDLARDALAKVHT